MGQLISASIEKTPFFVSHVYFHVYSVNIFSSSRGEIRDILFLEITKIFKKNKNRYLSNSKNFFQPLGTRIRIKGKLFFLSVERSLFDPG